MRSTFLAGHGSMMTPDLPIGVTYLRKLFHSTAIFGRGIPLVERRRGIDDLPGGCSQIDEIRAHSGGAYRVSQEMC